MRYRVYRIRNGIDCPEYYGIRSEDSPLMQYILSPSAHRSERLIFPAD